MSFSNRKILQALKENGCLFAREGSRHTILRARNGDEVQVPRHREVKRGTARAIAKQANIDWTVFEKAIS